MERDRKTEQRTELDPANDTTDTNAAADASSPPGHESERSGSCTCYSWKRRTFPTVTQRTSAAKRTRVDGPNQGRFSAPPWHGPTVLVTLARMNACTHSNHRRRENRSEHSEHGGVTVLLGATLLIVAYLVLQVTKLSVAAADRARAQTAADAAALSGVFDGEEAAADLARRNGATLISFTDEGQRVLVRVGFRDAVATARAERSETSPFS